MHLHLGEKGIRVNCVIPGPVWTPNIPGTMPIEEVENFGHEVALMRPGQPEELAPAYILLASDDGSFMTGSCIEVTGENYQAINMRDDHYPPGSVSALLNTDSVTPQTRDVLIERLERKK
ncbi:MAG: SDR family oxidoreductase [Chitinophagaceae bacterium]